ncbi:HNH endonuclease signature motif containing protein [Janthinobacterium rivuli]|uniref:HNH endonuclease signature motif containing protein n=1 Tax=Janthinobacterium rivuli TaxID=2751478 RepID=UPI000306C016
MDGLLQTSWFLLLGFHLIIKNRTELAIMGLGVDSATANKLRIAGHTLSKLKLSSPRKLLELGLSEANIKLLCRSKRPPIPPQTLSKVLCANRWSCCVCRTPERSIVVHHIKPWATSRDHSPENLAVVCSLHHGKVHSKFELEQNLTPKLLAQQKLYWESYCQQADLRLAMKDSHLRLNTWFYFNHLRIHEMARELNLNFKTVAGYLDAKKSNICNASGAVVKSCPEGRFLYSDGDRLILYDYISSMFFTCLERGNIFNISDYLDRGLLKTQLICGDIIMVQGLHTFTPVKPRPKGSDISKVWRKSNRVNVSSVINLEDSTSSSAWSVWLRGQQNVCVISKVRNIKRVGDNILIETTALAIRSHDDDFKHRAYDDRLWQSGLPFRDEHPDNGNEDESEI